MYEVHKFQEAKKKNNNNNKYKSGIRKGKDLSIKFLILNCFNI